jgi:hypothetical protein
MKTTYLVPPLEPGSQVLPPSLTVAPVSRYLLRRLLLLLVLLMVVLQWSRRCLTFLARFLLGNRTLIIADEVNVEYSVHTLEEDEPVCTVCSVYTVRTAR